MIVEIFSGFVRPDHIPWADIAAMGITTVYIGLNDEDDDRYGPGRGGMAEDLADTFEFRWGPHSAEHLLRGLDQALEHGIDVVLMPWWRPTRPWMESCAAAVLPLTDHPAVVSVLGDLERGWHKVIERGLSHEEAVARYFVPAFVERGVSLGLTCYASPVDASLTLLDYMDYVIPQCYTPARWTPPHLQPGVAQMKFAAAWQQHLSPDQQLIMGLGAWSQRRPGLTTRASMIRSARACAKAGVERIVYWSYPASGRASRRAIADIAHGRIDLAA